jgi:hypothetical protein
MAAPRMQVVLAGAVRQTLGGAVGSRAESPVSLTVPMVTACAGVALRK